MEEGGGCVVEEVGVVDEEVEAVIAGPREGLDAELEQLGRRRPAADRWH
ncbi:MAG: hypothetical protein ACRDUY_03590 [Nitriliruptorales bacterium]